MLPIPLYGKSASVSEINPPERGPMPSRFQTKRGPQKRNPGPRHAGSGGPRKHLAETCTRGWADGHGRAVAGMASWTVVGFIRHSAPYFAHPAGNYCRINYFCAHRGLGCGGAARTRVALSVTTWTLAGANSAMTRISPGSRSPECTMLPPKPARIRANPGRTN
jgi:hypothetical protein